MNIEGYLFRVRSPSLVAEAVDIFTIRVSNKRIVLGGDSLFIVLAVVQGVLDLAAKKRKNVSAQFIQFQSVQVSGCWILIE